MCASDAAARFNLFDHDALADFHLVNMGVSQFHVDKTKDYSNGILYRANGKRAPRQHAVNQISLEIRLHTPRGYTWYTDISHPHPPDFEGNVYSRLFTEMKTSFTRVLFSKRKDTATLVQHLDMMRQWIHMYVPGGRFGLLVCDFGGEYATQGRGDNIFVAGLSDYMDRNPGFRVHTLPPHSQDRSLVEVATNQIAGMAFANGCRSNLGASAWPILEMGAVFQHAHKSAHAANDPDAHLISRDARLHRQGQYVPPQRTRLHLRPSIGVIERPSRLRC